MAKNTKPGDGADNATEQGLTPEQEREAAYIWVRSTIPTNDDGSNKVVLSERDTDHPHEPNQRYGEVFIAGPKPVKVYPTSQVNYLLKEKILEECDAPVEKAPEKAADQKPI